MALRRVPAGGSAAVTVGRPSGVAAPTIVADAVERHASDEAPLSTAALIKEAIDTALESLDTLEHQARDTARRFRRGARAEAQLGLTHLMQSMQTLLRLAAMAAGASGTDLETFCERHELRAEGQTQIAVSELIRRQLAEDWSGLAATLDRSFSAALEGWRRVFIALGGTPTGPYGHAA